MDDHLSDSWDQPLTGREVGGWCVELIEEAIEYPAGGQTDRAQVLLSRLRSVGQSPEDLELVLWHMAQAAMLIAKDMEFYIDAAPMFAGVNGEEKLKRSVLSAKTAFSSGGQTTRPPHRPSSDG